MSTLLFVGFFLVLGLGTVLVAMRRGRRDPVLDPNKRSGRRAVAILTLLSVLVFAVVVPLAAGVDNKDSSKEAVSVQLTAQEERGRKLFSPTCSQCHVLKASQAVGR